MLFSNISRKMLIKSVLILFTSAVRSEGGFINASVKEVSMAPVIFITSVQTHVRSLTPSKSHFSRLQAALYPNKAEDSHISEGFVLAPPSILVEFNPNEPTGNSFY